MKGISLCNVSYMFLQLVTTRSVSMGKSSYKNVRRTRLLTVYDIQGQTYTNVYCYWCISHKSL